MNVTLSPLPLLKTAIPLNRVEGTNTDNIPSAPYVCDVQVTPALRKSMPQWSTVLIGSVKRRIGSNGLHMQVGNYKVNLYIKQACKSMRYDYTPTGWSCYVASISRCTDAACRRLRDQQSSLGCRKVKLYKASLHIDASRLYIHGLVITTEIVVDDVLFGAASRSCGKQLPQIMSPSRSSGLALGHGIWPTILARPLQIALKFLGLRFQCCHRGCRDGRYRCRR